MVFVPRAEARGNEFIDNRLKYSRLGCMFVLSISATDPEIKSEGFSG